jgi:hypothetical protein
VFGGPSPLWFQWDGEKLDRGEREFLELIAFKLDRISDAAVRVLRALGLPRVTCADAGLIDVDVADAVL